MKRNISFSYYKLLFYPEPHCASDALGVSYKIFMLMPYPWSCDWLFSPGSRIIWIEKWWRLGYSVKCDSQVWGPQPVCSASMYIENTKTFLILSISPLISCPISYNHIQTILRSLISSSYSYILFFLFFGSHQLFP